MTKTLLIVKGEVKRQVTLSKRYPFELISSLVVVIIGFIVLFSSVSISTDSGEADISTLFLRYGFGMLSMLMISEMGLNISREAQVGTLERIYSMPTRILTVITIRSVVSFISNIIQLAFFFVVGYFLFDLNFNFNLTSLVLFICFAFSLFAVGYVLSGLTLLYKKTGSLAQILQFVFLFLALLPYDSFPAILKWTIGYFPGVLPVQLISNSSTLGLLDVEIIVSCIFTISHVFIGLALFKYLERKALKKGSLGKY